MQTLNSSTSSVRSSRLKWLVALVILVVLVGLMGKGISQRKANNAATEAAAQVKKSNASIELANTDMIVAQNITLSQGLPLSGSLKAASSALVKAKLAGDLRGLTVREGNAVKAGQLLATIDATEYLARLSQVQRQADAAKAQVDIAQRSFDNNKSLMEQNFISKTALDTSLASLEGAKANYAAALAGADIAKKSMDDTRVLAPINGVVAQRFSQTGERVGPDTRIVEIVDLSRLELESALAASDSVAVRYGQTAQLQVEGNAKAVSAKVVRINPTATSGSRQVLVYLALDSSSELRQGLFAQGTLATSKVSGIAVPLGAVRNDKPQPYVQVVQDNKIVHQTVKLGARGEFAGTEYVLVTGIADNTTVLRGNVGALREGVLVQVPAPAAAPSGKGN
jgi:RND family efflux transporter MFP subunit